MTKLPIDEGENRVQEANAGGVEIYARPGRLRLHVVRVGPGVEVYIVMKYLCSNKPT